MTNQKVIVITGASRGIGQAVTKTLAARGHRLFLIASSLSSFQDQDIPATRLAGNFASVTDINNIVKQIQAETSHIDVLINNLGMFIGKPFQGTSTEELEQLLQVNFQGPVLFTQQMLPLLAKGNAPQMINISSVAAKQAMTDMAAYSASKAAVTGFSNALRKELNPQGIRLTVLHPAGVNTWNAPEPEHLLTPEDIANTVDFVVHTGPRCQIDEMSITSL